MDTPSSIVNSTASRLQRASNDEQVARPSFLLPPVKWLTPPSQMPIGIYFDFTTAIAKYAFSTHSNHINAIDLTGNNKGRWFVVWVCSASTYCGDELSICTDDVVCPWRVGTKKWYDSGLLKALSTF